MKTTQKISGSHGVRSITPGSKVGARHISRQTGVVQARDGEVARIRVLDYLGGGKLVIDLKGQRVVANTALLLEKNQEIEVLVKNIGDKIVLQLMSGAGQNISVESPAARSSLGDVIHQLMVSLENAEAEASLGPDETLRDLVQSVRELLQRMPVDVTEKDLPQQIQDAIDKLGHNYERKLADAFARGHFSAEEVSSHLKAKLMQLRSILREDPLRGTLLKSVEGMLNNMELQQLKSVSQAGKFQYFYVQLPFVMREQIATAELEFFRPKASHEQDDNSFNIVLNFHLQRLGHIEFTMNITDKNVNCRIKADEYETYMLAKEQAEDLTGRLTALGYSVSGMHCIIENSESNAVQYQSQIGMDEIDITV